MPIDIARHIGATTRDVVAREHDGRPARAVVALRAYDTTPDDLWDALTNIERIPRWFMPVSGDLRLGGRFQLTGNASGDILACEPPRALKLTWEYGGDVSWVDVQLTALPDGRTELRLEHIAHVDEKRWEQYGPGAVGVGWDMALFGLAEYLTSAAAVDPENAAAWVVSDEGKQFMRESSAGWGRAAIASGESPAQAEAAALRTTQAYLGETPPAEPTDAAGDPQ